MRISPANSRQQLQNWDSFCFLWLQSRSHRERYYPLYRALSMSGDGWLYVLILCAHYSLQTQDEGHLLAKAAVAFAIDLPIYLLLKNSFKRCRPEQYFQRFTAAIKPSDQFSFPSGHTAAAVLFALLLSEHYAALTPLLVAWAGAIAISRVMLGVHFPGDILAGSVLGAGCALLASSLTNYWWAG